ncbi:hypothetical protein C0Q70_10494 [Pomacea canaliculata]|uniref:Uncharacterized protein n=1 Tax=Pomacea canaliculata TaxID=400727 RepID=A0A2T7P3C9_POMCA|nr:hypothetical protein C0Q70_10494 [Pomacea canaliculata]
MKAEEESDCEDNVDDGGGERKHPDWLLYGAGLVCPSPPSISSYTQYDGSIFPSGRAGRMLVSSWRILHDALHLMDTRTPQRHQDTTKTSGHHKDTRTPQRHLDTTKTPGHHKDTRTPQRHHKDTRTPQRHQDTTKTSGHHKDTRTPGF